MLESSNQIFSKGDKEELIKSGKIEFNCSKYSRVFYIILSNSQKTTKVHVIFPRLFQSTHSPFFIGFFQNIQSLSLILPKQSMSGCFSSYSSEIPEVWVFFTRIFSKHPKSGCFCQLEIRFVFCWILPKHLRSKYFFGFLQDTRIPRDFLSNFSKTYKVFN